MDIPGALSLMPSTFVEGGAVPEGRLVISSAKFRLHDYGGKGKMTVSCLLELKDEDGGSHAQDYSVGSPERYAIVAEGRGIQGVGTVKGIVKSSNFAELLKHLVQIGISEAKVGNDIASIVGTDAEWEAVPQPERKGLVRTDDRERTMSVPTKLYKAPWDAGATISTSTAGATGSPFVAVDGSVSGAALTLVVALIAEKGQATRQEVAQRVFKDLLNDPVRDKVASLVFAKDTTWLTNAGFKIMGETISR